MDNKSLYFKYLAIYKDNFVKYYLTRCLSYKGLALLYLVKAAMLRMSGNFSGLP
jgi:hypothetical protein